MSVTFYPFETLPEQIEVDLNLGGAKFQQMSPTEIGLFDPPLSAQATVKVGAQLPSNWKSDVLHKSEQSKPQCEVVLLVHSEESRLRERVILKESSAGKFVGKLIVDPEVHSGSIKLSVVLVRSVFAAAFHRGYAQDKGAQLAWSNEFKIHLAKPPAPRGNHLEVRWKKFSEPSEFLSNYDQAFLSFEETSENPILYLNQDSNDALRLLMNYGGFGSPKARARDAGFAAVVTSVWQTMLTWSIFRLFQDANSSSEPVSLDLLKSWEAGVLKEAAPLLYPDVAPNKALDNLLAKIADKGGVFDLIARRIPAAAQQLAKLKDGMERLGEDHHNV
jgi:hypothetical protein